MISKAGDIMAKLCPKCGKLLDEDGFCEKCKLSFRVYHKIKNDSKALYNQGLELAKIRDLSGAINVLHKSLKLDKKNIDARNLLGLVYFEIGETVNALQQWVISKNFKSEDNIAEQYLKDIQENQTYLDKLSSAIKRYNQALAHMQQSNEDLAAIQLKKAVTLNPKFVKAFGLLAICYIKEQQIQKAQTTLHKILAIDKNNYMARKYMDAISDGDAKPEIEEKQEFFKENRERSYMVKNTPDFLSGSWHQVILVAGGALIGIAVALFLISPSQIKSLKNEKTSLEQEMTTIETQLQETQTALANETAKVNELEAANNQLSIDYQASKDLQAESAKVLTAKQFEEANDVMKAAETLLTVDASKLQGTQWATLYESLKSETFDKAAVSAYNTGYNIRNSDYEKAINLFTLSLNLVQDAYYSDRALYYRAIVHSQMNHIEEAKKDFNDLITNYPNSSKVSDATWRLTQLEPQ